MTIENRDDTMAIRVAINGFGRIGRNVLRAIVEAKRNDITVVAINDLAPPETNAHLLRFDSVHGRFPGEVTVKGDTHRLRHRPDQGYRPIAIPTQAALEGPRRRHRARMHRAVHVEGKGVGASEGRRQARAGLGARRRRRPHRGLRRQPRQADEGSHGGLQCLVHDQLPRAGGEGAARRGRHRARAS